ncbi:uncharacterized protein [Macrobrachium rosenbergii]|uniref:uncharacterized protein n=1 Tax=Macrobrachium rosenbergii TaxID=79674 RepID=UPI0034D608E6
MAYNPEANDIIERLHLLLTASVTARCQGRSWGKELPLVLLGVRTTPHMAFNASPPEALYGQSLTLPADVFQDPMSSTSPSNTCKALKQIMLAKTMYHMARKVYVPNVLQNAKYAFIRGDAHRTTLSPAYLGPYPIIQRRHIACQMTVDGRPTWVSIDQLKPAYLQDNNLQP